MDTSIPSDVVERQLLAYNARDIDLFMAQFADDACGYDLGALAPSMNGARAIRERYAQLFARSPRLHSVLISRTVFHHVVIDIERITGRNGSPDAIELMMIFETSGALIRRFHVVRPPA